MSYTKKIVEKYEKHMKEFFETDCYEILVSHNDFQQFFQPLDIYFRAIHECHTFLLGSYLAHPDLRDAEMKEEIQEGIIKLLCISSIVLEVISAPGSLPVVLFQGSAELSSSASIFSKAFSSEIMKKREFFRDPIKIKFSRETLLGVEILLHKMMLELIEEIKRIKEFASEDYEGFVKKLSLKKSDLKESIDADKLEIDMISRGKKMKKSVTLENRDLIMNDLNAIYHIDLCLSALLDGIDLSMPDTMINFTKKMQGVLDSLGTINEYLQERITLEKTVYDEERRLAEYEAEKGSYFKARVM